LAERERRNWLVAHSKLMRLIVRLIAAWLVFCTAGASAQPRRLEPGFNLFSTQQDIRLGREASVEVERKVRVLRHSPLTDYLSKIGNRLAQSGYAGKFPYSFQVVRDRNINAFALPGGPVYVNTGLLAAAENEAQLAGVLAHEMSHVTLRHGTNQTSKAFFIQIPAMLASMMTGHSLLGQLAQLGIGFGANSILLKNSRSAEAQADYNGAEMMADAGYNPIEMAHFFEKLQAGAGRDSRLTQFLSDHPNPGNRVRAIQEEIRELPRREYTAGSGEFPPMHSLALPFAGR
jgi:predicted Zn-dependent protease